jgi:protein gp37
MADGTKIEWTDATWNPITGCFVVSPGCTNCYAMKLAGTRLKHHPTRAGLTTESKAGPVWNGQVRFNESMLFDPLKWRRPRMIFVCAHGDLFAENVPDEWIDHVFAVMALAPQHTFQVLTKRPERMRDYLQSIVECYHASPEEMDRRFGGVCVDLTASPCASGAFEERSWPLRNVWLGVSVEDQKRADERIPILLETPAAVRWISAEPLLGPVDISRWTASANVTCKACKKSFWLHAADPCKHHDESRGGWTLACPNCGGCRCKPSWTEMDARCGTPMEPPADWVDRQVGRFDKVHPTIELTSMIDWVVAGGESGHGARPMHPDWARLLRDQCTAAGVPFLFKQWGEHTSAKGYPGGTPISHVFDDGFLMVKPGKRAAGRLLDGIEHNAFPQPIHPAPLQADRPSELV